MAKTDKCRCGKWAELLVTIEQEGPMKGFWQVFCYECYLVDAEKDPNTKANVRFRTEEEFNRIREKIRQRAG